VVGEAGPEPVAAGLPEIALVLVATAVALTGLALGWLVYGSGLIDWAAVRVRLGVLQRALSRGWYVDDVYGSVVVVPGKVTSAFLAYVFDQRVIDGAVNGLGSAFGRLAGTGRRVQTGLVRSYALVFLLGAVALLLFVVWRS
jgi:NADH-quinone oxidoreductase subunit L